MAKNTIGGASSNDNLICPGFIRKSACDRETAVKYDLNFLRRYMPGWDDENGSHADEARMNIFDQNFITADSGDFGSNSNATVVDYYVNRQKLPNELNF